MQANRFWLGGPRISIHNALDKLATRRFENQFGAARAGPVRDTDVRAALETIGSVGAQIERLRGAPNVRRLETGAFDQYVFGLLVDLGVLSAHDTRQGDGLGFIGNEQHVPGQSCFWPSKVTNNSPFCARRMTMVGVEALNG